MTEGARNPDPVRLPRTGGADGILASHAAGHPRPDDDALALVEFARHRGFPPTQDRVSLHALVGIGPSLRTHGDAEAGVAGRWDDIVRATLRAQLGLPAVPARAAPGSVSVLSFREAFLEAGAFDAVLTVEDVEASRRLRLPGRTQAVLAFDDLDEDDGETPVATAEHVREALRFGRGHADGSLLVHCQAGQCRSPGLALAILADRLGPGKEAEAVERLLAVRPRSAANLLVVSLADEALGRDGALRSAWDAHERGNEDLARVRFLRGVAHERFTGRSSTRAHGA